MQQIPEWKRGALVVIPDNDAEKEEVESLMRRIKKKISSKV
jgi:hypothetical protein